MIPFNRPYSAPATGDYLLQALASQRHSGNGHFGSRCAQLLAKLSGARQAYLTPSGTSALEMTALLLHLQPGDEVIVPSFTYVSTACAYAIFGVRPVFVDVLPDNLNIDPDLVEAAITPRTRALVAVHYGGVACDMERLADICARHQLKLVEDNAHGLLASYRGRPLGGFGALATLSFHETKNFSCGEGGALLVNDPDLLERAEVAQDKGTNRAQFMAGKVDSYTWVGLGSSYLLGEYPAAALWANLEDRDNIQRRRQEIWQRYHHELRDWAQRHGIAQTTVPADCQHPAHLYYLLVPDSDRRARLIDHLKACLVQVVFHYQPLHLSPMGRGFGGVPGQCPVTERITEQIVRLPLFATLSQDEQTRVIEALHSWVG